MFLKNILSVHNFFLIRYSKIEFLGLKIYVDGESGLNKVHVRHITPDNQEPNRHVVWKDKHPSCYWNLHDSDANTLTVILEQNPGCFSLAPLGGNTLTLTTSCASSMPHVYSI